MWEVLQMSKVCGDCYYSKYDNGWKCKKGKSIYDSQDDACSKFLSEDTKSCLYCYYYAADSSYFAGDKDGVCTRTDKSIKDDDIACGHFIEE